MAHPSGPTFLDFPSTRSSTPPSPSRRDTPASRRAMSPTASRRRRSLAEAERPAIMAGTGLYWARGEEELRALAEALGAPVFLNGMGRGCLPADHELAFSRARGHGLEEADVALAMACARLPPGLRWLLRRGDQARVARRGAEQAHRNRKPDVELVGGIGADARRDSRRLIGCRPVTDLRLGRGGARHGGFEARGGAGRS